MILLYRSSILLFIVLSLFPALLQGGQPEFTQKERQQVFDFPYTDNRTHRASNMWLTVNNWGFLGNFNPSNLDAYDDPEYPGQWAPQCEYPGGSDVQYLYTASLWIGALIVNADGTETPRVSVGSEGWLGGHEFWPGAGDDARISERSLLPGKTNRLGEYVYDSLAVSEQDFRAAYTDTLTDQSYVEPSDYDGVHVPLGIEIIQESHAWSYSYAEHFIIIDYEITNIADKYLKNLYVGLYVDGDVGLVENNLRKNDDICGFRKTALDTVSNQFIEINTAWIADNNGRQDGVQSGNDFTAPDVTGMRVLRAPNPLLRTSFNWWISNPDPSLDFGPSWQYWIDTPGSPGEWTGQLGTPLSDANKYFLLGNREFDYDQYYVDDPTYVPQHPDTLWLGQGGDFEVRPWQSVAGDVALDLANGYDTRYLLSWGPLGIYDHTDQAGRNIYRLNPGETFSMTIAYIVGRSFHDGNHPQVHWENVDPGLYDYSNLQYNALWAQRVYDNEMHDTPIYDYGPDGKPGTADPGEGDGVLDTGDGWFGEDVGVDGLYALNEGDTVRYFGEYVGIYPGPDQGEQDAMLQPEEDALLWSLQTILADSGLVYAGPKFSGSFLQRDWQLGHLGGNNFLDLGDGIPDFQGPPPPPSPYLQYELNENQVILRWATEAERFLDPFSHIYDFEGYRIWVSNSGLPGEWSQLGDFDLIDYAYYTPDGRLMTLPGPLDFGELPPDSLGPGWEYRIVSVNNGMEDILNPRGYCEEWTDLNENGHYDNGEPFTDENDNGLYDFGDDYSCYEFVIHNARPLFPRYYAVTSYDFGDYQTGTEPLESAPGSNALYLAPAGAPAEPVRVVPNPYLAYHDYTQSHELKNSVGGLSWENQDDGTPSYYPQYDRRIEFINLPQQAIVRIYNVAGDLVQLLPHNIAGDSGGRWESDFSEGWDLNNRNFQQVAAGLYLFSVEDRTSQNRGNVSRGKFVIIR